MSESPELKTQQDEKPTLETQEKTAATVQQEAMELLGKLEKLGVRRPEELEGMAIASQQAGNLANMLGTIRQENAELKRMLQDVTAKAQQPQSAYDPYSNQPIDLKSVVREAVEGFYQEKFIKPQQEAQTRFQAEVKEVMDDELYPVIGSQFEEFMKMPSQQFRVTSGQSSLSNEWRNFSRKYTSQLLKNVTENYKKLLGVGAKPTAGEPPHMEEGGAHQYTLPEKKPDTMAKLKKIQEQTKGGDEDLAKMIATLFESSA